MNGISLTLYTSKVELDALKAGSTTLIASPKPQGDNFFQISVSVDSCDVVGDQVRVNTIALKKAMDDIGNQMGVAIGQALETELTKVMKLLEE